MVREPDRTSHAAPQDDQLMSEHRRFHHLINSDKVFGTHRHRCLFPVPSGAMREWSSHAKLGYPVTFGDATAIGAALAFLISRPYSFRTLGGNADVYFLKQIRSRIRIRGDLSRGANGRCPSRPCDILDPKLARRLRWQSNRRPELEHLRQLSEL